MFSNVLGSMDGAEIYAIIGLLMFVTMFTGVAIWVIRMDKSYLSKMENLPLESDTDVSNNTES